jgi:hypothetical protein
VRDEAVSHLADINQFCAVIIDDDRVERVIGNVAADDELLTFVDSMFYPSAASLAGFVN